VHRVGVGLADRKPARGPDGAACADHVAAAGTGDVTGKTGDADDIDALCSDSSRGGRWVDRRRSLASGNGRRCDRAQRGAHRGNGQPDRGHHDFCGLAGHRQRGPVRAVHRRRVRRRDHGGGCGRILHRVLQCLMVVRARQFGMAGRIDSADHQHREGDPMLWVPAALAPDRRCWNSRRRGRQHLHQRSCSAAQCHQRSAGQCSDDSRGQDEAVATYKRSGIDADYEASRSAGNARNHVVASHRVGVAVRRHGDGHHRVRFAECERHSQSSLSGAEPPSRRRCGGRKILLVVTVDLGRSRQRGDPLRGRVRGPALAGVPAARLIYPGQPEWWRGGGGSVRRCE